MRNLVCAVLALGLAGCNCDPTGGDDAGADAGLPDAGASDAGLPDAGPGDAGAPDAGAPDAGPGDAGTDAGVGRDDAGCPVLFTGVVLDPAQAGLPDAGLRLWLRGDLGVAATPDGGVCRWEDLSGHANHVYASSAVRAALLPAGLRGRPAVFFSGTNRYLVTSGVLGIPATSGRTVAVIGATQDTTHRFQYFIQGVGGSGGTYFNIDMNTYLTAGAREGVYATNNAYDADLASSTEVRTHVYSISSFAAGGALPGVLSYRVSGVPRTLTRTPGGAGNGTVEDFSAANFTGVGTAEGAFAGAVVGDLLVYDRALTVPEQAAVEAYLQARYPAP